MNMVGMNPTAGGPVGGMMMMNNGGPGTPSNNFSIEGQKIHLNTCIYDYFLRSGMYDSARQVLKDPKFDIRFKAPVKQSPGRRKDGDMNGVDDAMDMDGDMKDDIPEDLPRPQLGGAEAGGQGFLFDWFCIFADIYSAQRNKGEMTAARQYWTQTQHLQRLRENQQNQTMPRQGVMGGPNQYAMRRNGIVNGDMKNMAQSMTPQQIQQLAAQQKMQLQRQQMQREHSDMDMNGRPGTPADGENGGSPSKRPRLGDQQFNGAMGGPNGRMQGMPGAQQQMLMQSFNQQNMSPAQIRAQTAAMQQQKAAMQGQMGNAMMNMANSGSPMLGPMPDGQFANGMPVEMFNQRMPGQPMQGGPGGQGGNHALQDYQMQLMLLEQQNKKRLMMARQEQDSIGKQPDGSFPGGMQPGMSPSGSRSGTSPNPTEQMKRGTPQLGGLPGSPSGGDTFQGRSPGMNLMNNGMPPDFNAVGFGGPGGPGMQPPNPMNMGPMARANQGRMPGQFSGGQPMVQNPSQGQTAPMGTPGQRSDMPPPQAPAAGNANQRAQPASPQQNPAPPTPSQSKKAAPKKKGKEGDNKKNAKKNSTTNAADAEPPATPAPATPVTPQNPNSFSNSAGKGNAQGGAPNNGPTSNPTSAPQPTIQPELQVAPFGYEAPDPTFNLDFSTLDSNDVLGTFDFDSFLNADGAGEDFNFGDSSLNVESFGLDGPVD